MRGCLVKARIVLTALTTAFTLAVSPAAAEHQLGKIDFPTSAGAEAQEHFLRGMLFLHSFEYRDARDAFRAAQEAEPGFAMAHWGEAMSHNHPIWFEENLEGARDALARLAPSAGERAAKAPSEREKAYLHTAEILFGEGSKRPRDLAFSAAMGRLAERFPDDLEARSLYALSILGTSHGGRDTATYMRAAAVVEEVFDANPEHPGALHYLIHSYDDPVHAPLGLRPARIYGRIAPDAGHALHMPSHIFLALGMWDETVASNLDAWRAGERKVARESASSVPLRGNLHSDRRNYHALYWLHYAYLQQGRIEAATRLLDIMQRDAKATGSARARTHLALMRAAQIVEAQRWDELPKGASLEGLSPTAVAADHFAAGFAALRTEDLDAARAALAAIRERIDAALSEDRRTSGEGYTRTVRPRTRHAEVAALELEALIRLAEGDEKGALELLDEATAAENELPFGFGPASPVKPSYELYGEVLLALGRPAEAREKFDVSLRRNPRRARSVLGQLRAARGSGDAETAEASARELTEIWSQADPEVEENAELSKDEAHTSP